MFNSAQAYSLKSLIIIPFLFFCFLISAQEDANWSSIKIGVDIGIGVMLKNGEILIPHNCADFCDVISISKASARFINLGSSLPFDDKIGLDVNLQFRREILDEFNTGSGGMSARRIDRLKINSVGGQIILTNQIKKAKKFRIDLLAGTSFLLRKRSEGGSRPQFTTRFLNGLKASHFLGKKSYLTCNMEYHFAIRESEIDFFQFSLGFAKDISRIAKD